MNAVELQIPDHLNFRWTVGNDPELSHRRVIDAYASGEVHEVNTSLPENTAYRY
jgi:hypothetical protein